MNEAAPARLESPRNSLEEIINTAKIIARTIDSCKVRFLPLGALGVNLREVLTPDESTSLVSIMNTPQTPHFMNSDRDRAYQMLEATVRSRLQHELNASFHLVIETTLKAITAIPTEEGKAQYLSKLYEKADGLFDKDKLTKAIIIAATTPAQSAQPAETAPTNQQDATSQQAKNALRDDGIW